MEVSFSYRALFIFFIENDRLASKRSISFMSKESKLSILVNVETFSVC